MRKNRLFTRTLTHSLGQLISIMLLAGILTAGFAFLSPQAHAQQPMSQERAESLIQKLENPEQRQALIEDLKSLQKAEEQQGEQEARPGGWLEFEGAEEALSGLTRQGKAILHFVADIPDVFSWLTEQITGPDKRFMWGEILFTIVLAVLFGIAAEKGGEYLLRKPHETLHKQRIKTLAARVTSVIAALVIELIPIAVFAVAAYVVLSISGVEQMADQLITALLAAVIFVKVTKALGRVFFSPADKRFRPFELSNETAGYLYKWTRVLAGVAFYGAFVIQAAGVLGVAGQSYDGLMRFIYLVFGLLVIVFILQNRDDVRKAIYAIGRDQDKKEKATGVKKYLGMIWHYFAVAYVVAFYLVWASGSADGFQYVAEATGYSLIVIFVAAFIMTMISRGVDSLREAAPALTDELPSLSQRMGKYFASLRVVLKTIVVIFALFGILHAWGLESYDWLTSDMGLVFLKQVAIILLVTAVGFVIWEVANSFLIKLLSSAGENSTKATRMRTLLPLMRKALMVVLVLLGALVILSEVGVDIAPLLAGAGVLGLAVGFGAQTLVKDVITGLFILMEDILQIGDVVDISGTAGVVEEVSVRTVILRDISGNRHTIPWSSVGPITNMTKFFSIALIECGFAYRENVDEVLSVLEELTNEFYNESKFKDVIIEEPMIDGVLRLDNSAVVIRVRFKTKPGEQWALDRAFKKRMKDKFDEVGIEIPFPHQTIYFGEDKDGSAPSLPVRVENKSAGQGQQSKQGSS